MTSRSSRRKAVITTRATWYPFIVGKKYRIAQQLITLLEILTALLEYLYVHPL